MPDFDAISTAIATRFAAAQVTPPAGLQNIRLATADLPNQIGVLPCVLVLPVEGTFNVGAGSRQGDHDFVARFYLTETADLTRDMPALRKWLTVLVDQLRLATQLGGTVTVARVTGWKLGLMRYVAIDYSGIELGIHVTTNEGWQVTS